MPVGLFNDVLVLMKCHDELLSLGLLFVNSYCLVVRLVVFCKRVYARGVCTMSE